MSSVIDYLGNIIWLDWKPSHGRDGGQRSLSGAQMNFTLEGDGWVSTFSMVLPNEDSLSAVSHPGQGAESRRTIQTVYA